MRHGIREWLLRQGAEISIVFVLALLGGACGWLLRDELAKRDDEMRRETSHLQMPLNARTSELLLAPGEPDRMEGHVHQHIDAGLNS